MKYLLFSLLLLPFTVMAQVPAENYPVDPMSVAQPGVPKGELLKFTLANSKIFPGTMHEYWVYIPVQYDPHQPACVYVNQDAVQSNAPIVFDNLIAAKEMPVTIGVFVTPGRVVAADQQKALDRYNRSYEYDGLGDNYARFILGELLPDVEKQKATDGRIITLSKNGNDRAIGGTSSGGVAAFTAAWERPDAFTRVVTGVGTYVGLRGADRYATLLRKYEPKPIRVFLADGSNDNNSYAGDWWMANQAMERSLTFAGYEVAHVWGEGPHGGKHLASLFPAAMRFLWKDWPKPVAGGTSKNAMLKDLLVPGEQWKLVTGRPKLTGSNNLEAHNGNKYTITRLSSGGPARILLTAGRTSTPVEKNLAQPGGLALTPDQTQLYITDAGSHWIYLYSVGKDGTLANKQRFNWLYSPDEEDFSGARGITCDTAGRVYVATLLGVQICDQAGRVNVILPTPSGFPSELGFGGENRDLLFAICGDKVYSRKLSTRGVDPKEAPIKPAKPKL